MWKKVGLTFAGIVGVLVVAAAITYALNATLLTRFFTFSPDTATENPDWYQPVVVVRGDPAPPLPIAPDAERTIAEVALEDAVALAATHDTAALLVWHRGALQLEYYAPGFGPDSIVETASMHKSLLALLYGVALAEGVIPSLDEPAATWIPAWRDDDRQAIRLRHLLWMSAGLEATGFSPNPFSTGARLFLGTRIDEVATSLLSIEPPLERFTYSNAASQILGHVLEQAAGRPYEALLEDWLWQPLGAHDARLWMDREGGMPRTYCCLLARASDWMRIGLMILNDGRVDDQQVVPAAWIAEMTEGSPVNPIYGYQIWRGSPHTELRGYGSASNFQVPAAVPFRAEDVVYFDGFGGQRVYVIPSQEMVIVRTGRASFTWDDSQLPNILMDGILAAPAGEDVNEADEEDPGEDQPENEERLPAP